MYKHPQRGVIMICTDNGRKIPADATIVRYLAVNIRPNMVEYIWTVSSVDQGYAIPYEFPSEESALCCAMRIDALFKDVPPNENNEIYWRWARRCMPIIEKVALEEGGRYTKLYLPPRKRKSKGVQS